MKYQVNQFFFRFAAGAFVHVHICISMSISYLFAFPDDPYDELKRLALCRIQVKSLKWHLFSRLCMIEF